jgi:Lon protease-like protein
MVVFPGEELNLHIFEPRYKALINEIRSSELGFGISLFKDEKLFAIGTESRLLHIFKTYSDGRMDIQLIGDRRFMIIQSYSKIDGKEYGGADIEWLPDINQNSEELLRSLVALHLEELYKLLKIEREIYAADGNIYLHDLVHYIGLSLEQENELLSLNTGEEQWNYVLDFLEYMIPAINASISMRKKAAMNGVFKNLDSPIDF